MRSLWLGLVGIATSVPAILLIYGPAPDRWALESGAIHGVGLALALKVRRPTRLILVGLAGAIGMHLAVWTALEGLGLFPFNFYRFGGPVQWATFPVAGLLGALFMAAGLRGAGLNLGARTLAGYLLAAAVASYATLIIAYAGIPIWQAATAATLARVAPPPPAPRRVRLREVDAIGVGLTVVAVVAGLAALGHLGAATWGLFDPESGIAPGSKAVEAIVTALASGAATWFERRRARDRGRGREAAGERPASETVLVASFPSRQAAEVARAHLDAQGIRSLIEADDCGGMRPSLSFSRRGAGLYVLAEHADAARAALAPRRAD